MTISFPVPKFAGTYFHSTPFHTTYRGLDIAIGVCVEIDTKSDSYCASLDCSVNRISINLHELLHRVAGNDPGEAFIDHVNGGDPLDDRWYAAVEKALDLHIDMSGTAQTQAIRPPIPTLELVTLLCATATALPGHNNYERDTLVTAHSLLRTEPIDVAAILEELEDGRAHAFRPDFTENRPESWLVEACIRLMANA